MLKRSRGATNPRQRDNGRQSQHTQPWQTLFERVPTRPREAQALRVFPPQRLHDGERHTQAVRARVHAHTRGTGRILPRPQDPRDSHGIRQGGVGGNGRRQGADIRAHTGQAFRATRAAHGADGQGRLARGRGGLGDNDGQQVRAGVGGFVGRGWR